MLGVRRWCSGASPIIQFRPPAPLWQRDALLLGTAFTALFASGLIEQTPAAAVDQIIVQSQTRTAGDSKSVNNSSKLTATLDETIANATLAFANTLGGSNSGVLGGDLFQLIDFTQQILVNNDITIINSGDIDPLI